MGKKQKPPPPSDLGLETFRRPPPGEGISLDQLSQAFAAMLASGDDPYASPPGADDDPLMSAAAAAQRQAAAGTPYEHSDGLSCDISPRSILEALLFVGLPGNQPVDRQQAADLMRGISTTDIDELVAELNGDYLAANCAYHIVSQAPGYRLVLRDEFSAVRERLRGGAREARLSQAAIEVLAIVAYNEPLTADQVAELRGTASGHVLQQLVARRLLTLERTREDSRRVTRYRTTPRFLELFGLASRDDLPRSQEIQRA